LENIIEEERMGDNRKEIDKNLPATRDREGKHGH
jgi:hypothetical protein